MTRRQEQMLDEIGRIALAEGFAHLRVADLAERLHCSRATLYDLAPTKDVFLCAFFRSHRRHVDRIRERTDATRATRT